MQQPKQHRLAVTLDTKSGRIIRTVTLTDTSVISAKRRAVIVAKPGQVVVDVQVAR